MYNFCIVCNLVGALSPALAPAFVWPLVLQVATKINKIMIYSRNERTKKKKKINVFIKDITINYF